MPNLTQLITRQSGLAGWYPLTNDAVNASTILDASGLGRNLAAAGAGIDRAVVTADVLNGQKAVVCTDDTAYFQHSTAFSVRDVFIVAKVDDATDFVDPYRGLLSGVDDTNYPLLVGVGSTTRWLNNAEGAPSMGWLLDDVLQAEGSRTAPFDAFRRIRVTTSGAAIAMDGLQVGQDREHGDRLFAGKWADLVLFSTQRTDDEAKAIALYQDLKFNLWRTNSTTLHFPTPGMTGIAYRHFREVPYDWSAITETFEYDDRGRDFNEVSDAPPREWVVEFDCVSHTHALAKSQYEIFDEFWNAVRISRTFSFTDKYGTTHTNVRVKDYSRSHAGHKSWQNSVAFQLVKYP